MFGHSNRFPGGQPRLAPSLSEAGASPGGSGGEESSGRAGNSGRAGASGRDRRRPRLVVTMGDPAGVGPEVALRVLADDTAAPGCDLSIIGDPSALSRWSGRLSMPSPTGVVDPGVSAGEVEPGRPTVDGARAALAAIETAARMCMSGEADAMVTAPVSKSEMAATGVDFPGHTEFLAGLTAAAGYVMTFVHGDQRIGLVTTHLPLSEVPAAITTELVLSKLRMLAGGLSSWLGVESPSIAVTALNPHGGEGGRFGEEDANVIAPAVALARKEGVDAAGPFPADSIFVGHGDREAGGPGSGYDAILAMYHDQGTIAAKLMGFGRCVNLTLGLPIVRTSVDHGTAFDRAGSAGVDHSSMAAAVRLAAAIAARRVESLDGRSR